MNGIQFRVRSVVGKHNQKVVVARWASAPLGTTPEEPDRQGAQPNHDVVHETD